MELSIIIVNWNSVDFLLDCLASIRTSTKSISYEVIVVDNASAETDVETLRQKCLGITLIQSKENLGFARANNLGFRHATGQYVLLLNPDTKLVGPAINTMLEQIERLPFAGIVGCKLLNTDLSVQLSSIRSFPKILNQVFDAEYLFLRWPSCPVWNLAPLFSNNEDPAPVDVISGACMLLRREVFEQVGMFSEDYFMYAEDIDLNYKVKQAGFSNYYLGGATIIHHGGKSSGQRVSQWSTIMQYNAMVRYYRKTRGRPYELLYRGAMGCAAAGRLMVLAFAYPLGTVLNKKNSLHYAMSKWTAVLRWAVGRPALSAAGR
jgi:N-acetylglucosaminyl-diphospho-decaprenol L-rhamnosyltransferase